LILELRNFAKHEIDECAAGNEHVFGVNVGELRLLKHRMTDSVGVTCIAIQR